MESQENLQLGNTTQLDVVLPSQHFGAPRRQTPEQRLMIAVLHDALDCVEKYRFATDIRGQQLFREAKQWFLADEAGWPYSFECICGVLDLDPNAVRQRLHVAPSPRASRNVMTTWAQHHRDLGTARQADGGASQ